MDSPEIMVLDTTPHHIALMAAAMDTLTVGTAVRLGVTPKKAIWQSYRRSLICKTAFIQGKIAAIWGVGGSIFTDTGQPWLVLTPEVEEHPFRVCFRYRRELQKMQHMFPILEEYVDITNIKAIRLLKLMGFKINKNEIPLGGAVFRRAERRVS